jgi:hypothetical protein
MATLQTALTPLGYKTLISSGLIDNIVYYNLNDNYHNYLVGSEESLIPSVVGSHNTITTSECAFANYTGVYLNKPVPTEVKNALSKVQFSFVNEECSYGDFNQPNLNININLYPWFQQLNSATYAFNMTENLVLDLWDYVTATIQTLNVSTKNYDDVNYLTNLNVSYKFKTDFDKQNFSKISPIGVTLEQGGQRVMVDNSNIRFGSPFLISFSTYPVNGTNINGTSGRFSLKPNKWGYWVNNNNFISTTDLEDSDLAGYKTIYPAAVVGTNIYYLPNNTPFQTKNGLIGYAINMINVNGNGDNMLNGLINQGTLFMKTYGIYDSTYNYYTLPINMEVLATHPEINSITNKFGGNVRLNFIYDVNNTTSNPIQLL